MDDATPGPRHPTLPVFDAHLHIIDPRFPLIPNRGYLPAPFTVSDYIRATATLGVMGGAVVAGSFQGFDQDHLVAALAELGPAFVGVAQLPPEIGDAQILALDRAGVRAVRFNLHRGMQRDGAAIESLALRVHALCGWHAELYLNAKDLPDLGPLLDRLPMVVIDHLGLSRRGLPHLLRQVARGARVKATGFGRIDFDPTEAIAAIHRESPRALLFGTDLPCTRATRPFEPEDLDLIAKVLADGAALARVLSQNALRLYRPRQGKT